MTFSVRRLTPERTAPGHAVPEHKHPLRLNQQRRIHDRPATGPSLTVDTSTADAAEGVTATIAPVGEVDLDSAYRIREAVDAALFGRKPTKIVIDLGKVDLIDSVGIGVLVSCYHAAAACRVPLVAAHPSCTVYRQLWVSGLVGLFRLAIPNAEHAAA